MYSKIVCIHFYKIKFKSHRKPPELGQVTEGAGQKGISVIRQIAWNSGE